MPVNDTWTRLGRDDAGRFITGAPPAPDSDTGIRRLGPLPDTRKLSPQAQLQAVTYGVLGHLPATQRGRYEALLANGGLQRLTTALQTWHAAADLDRDAFRDRFLGGRGSDAVVDYLRKAASGAAATTPGEVTEATTSLAAAHQAMGANLWPTFMTAAHQGVQAPVVPVVAAEPQGEAAS